MRCPTNVKRTAVDADEATHEDMDEGYDNLGTRLDVQRRRTGEVAHVLEEKFNFRVVMYEELLL